MTSIVDKKKPIHYITKNHYNEDGTNKTDAINTTCRIYKIFNESEIDIVRETDMTRVGISSNKYIHMIRTSNFKKGQYFIDIKWSDPYGRIFLETEELLVVEDMNRITM